MISPAPIPQIARGSWRAVVGRDRPHAVAWVRSHLCRLLRLRRLEGLLPVAADHNAGQEAADDGAAEEDEDDGDADGPDARREEGLQGVVLVDEGLLQTVNANSHDLIYYTEVLVGLEYMFRFGRGMVRGKVDSQCD